MSKQNQMKLYERTKHSNRIVEGIVGVKSELGQLSLLQAMLYRAQNRAVRSI